MKYFFLLFVAILLALILIRRTSKKATLICIRQEDARVWPNHLGAKTSGLCSSCNEPIYFESQNEWIERKICYQCSSAGSP